MTGHESDTSLDPRMKPTLLGEWMPLEGELWREYVFPEGVVYRIENPMKVIIKRTEIGDSHRVVAKRSGGGPISHYVRAGWIAIRWVGIDDTEQYDW